jgi:hypothetical protein
MKRNEKIYFEGFKRTNISEKELKNAKKKTSFLREKEEKLLLLVRMVKAILKGEYRIALGSLALLIAAVIYVISLIDAASYFVAFIRWLDDVGVVVGIIFRILEYIMSNFEKYEKEKNKMKELN